MNDWNELQQKGKALGVLERGMTMEQLQAAVAEAEARGDTAEEEIRQDGRVPFGSYRLNLEVPPRLKKEGFYYRFFKQDNISRAEAAGYLPVIDEGSVYDPDNREHQDKRNWYTVSKGRNDDGSPQTLYLMEQPMVFREEDKAIRRAELDAVDEAIQRGDRGAEQLGNAAYIPNDTREISTLQS